MFKKHGIPFWSMNQISKDTFKQIGMEMKDKHVDSKYIVKDK